MESVISGSARPALQPPLVEIMTCCSLLFKGLGILHQWLCPACSTAPSCVYHKNDISNTGRDFNDHPEWKITRQSEITLKTSHDCEGTSDNKESESGERKKNRMTSIYLIIMALAKTALVQGSIECTFSEEPGTQQCSGAVGQILRFHLRNTADTDLKLRKDNQVIILTIKKNKIAVQNKEYAGDAKLLSNGSFILGTASKNHSGDYTLEEHYSDGLFKRKVNLHLFIQAPVSKPAVSQVCSSAEQRSINCSSEGEEVEFIFTLDSVKLVQMRDHSQFLNSRAVNMEGAKTEQDLHFVSISLPGQLTGNLKCSVWNKVSREETVIHLNSCKGVHPGFLHMAVRHGVGTVLLLALCLAVCIVLWKTRSTSVPEDASNEYVLQEITT
ncbi:uncharacterized protein LOC117812457 [Notolabrus celidotus]|uniref:uncharacterized protein LOC117812457 n=1 Tax=Notolabrus celidotus TaxID=1203425 RepID=UPI0014905955|nr:uncharacterized protein LOC117812457 [Notolabrus celidotus]